MAPTTWKVMECQDISGRVMMEFQDISEKVMEFEKREKS